MIQRALSTILELAPLAAMRNGDTAVVQGRFRQLFRQYFRRGSLCFVLPLGPHWENTTAPQRLGVRQALRGLHRHRLFYLLGRLSGESITVLGSQPNEEGVIVTSRINGIVAIAVDWQLNRPIMVTR